MSYATTARRPHPLAAFGALGVPATFAVILIAGLAVKHVIVPPIPNPIASDIPDVVITPTVIEPDLPATDTKAPVPETSTPPISTRPESDFTFDLGPSAPVGTLEGIDTGSLIGTEDFTVTLPPVEPMFDPIAASPRGNPANWISTSDYRSTWIRRELTGVARFTLQIDAAGKVSNCTITGSTGHEPLDKATCRLIEGRAVFNPAKGTDGKPVAGTFSSSVNWQIP